MAEIIYEYVRSKRSDGNFDFNNPDRVDGSGNQIYLSKEIETALPGKKFKVRCNFNSLKIVFSAGSLADAEKIMLDQVVEDHRNNA